MLNNIFINENSLNKFSARTKQSDPITALDQASSFAGALATQVSINQNSNQSNSPSTSSNTNSTAQATTASPDNTTASNNNNTTQQANNNQSAAPANNSNNAESAKANNDSKPQELADKTNNNSAAQPVNKADTAQNDKTAGKTARFNAATNLISNSQVQITQSLQNIDGVDTKNNSLSENFQKIIANLQGRKNIAANTATPSHVANTKDGAQSTKISNIVAEQSITNTDNNKDKLDLKPRARVIADGLKNPVLNQKNNIDAIRNNVNARETTISNEKLFIESQNQVKNIAKNIANAFDRPVVTEAQASNINTQNPMFGLVNTGSQGLTTSNVNIQQAAIATNVNSPQWGNDLGRQMVNMIRIAENGMQTAELRLDPPELGPLRVTINLNDGVVNAVFSSMNANVRTALEQSLPQLQQQLQQEGLSLGQADVGQDNQSSQHAQDKNTNNTNGLIAQNQDGVSLDSDTTQSTIRATDPNALLDTYA